MKLLKLLLLLLVLRLSLRGELLEKCFLLCMKFKNPGIISIDINIINFDSSYDMYTMHKLFIILSLNIHVKWKKNKISDNFNSINNSIIETYIFCGINNQWYVVVKDLSNGMLFKVYIECYVHIGK